MNVELAEALRLAMIVVFVWLLVGAGYALWRRADG